MPHDTARGLPQAEVKQVHYIATQQTFADLAVFLSQQQQLRHLSLHIGRPYDRNRVSPGLITSLALPSPAELLSLDLSRDDMLLPAWLPRLEEMSQIQSLCLGGLSTRERTLPSSSATKACGFTHPHGHSRLRFSWHRQSVCAYAGAVKTISGPCVHGLALLAGGGSDGSDWHPMSGLSQSLTLLTLGGGACPRIPCSAIACLAVMTNLQELELIGCDVGADSASSAAVLVPLAASLTRLQVHACGFGLDQAQGVCHRLLYEPCRCDDCIKATTAWLQQLLPSLQWVSVDNCSASRLGM